MPLSRDAHLFYTSNGKTQTCNRCALLVSCYEGGLTPVYRVRVLLQSLLPSQYVTDTYRDITAKVQILLLKLFSTRPPYVYCCLTVVYWFSTAAAAAA